MQAAPAVFRRYEVSDQFVVDVYDDNLLLHRPHKRAIVLAVTGMVVVLLGLVAFATGSYWLLVGSLPVLGFQIAERMRSNEPRYLIDRQTGFVYRQLVARGQKVVFDGNWLPMGRLADYLLITSYEQRGEERVLMSVLEGPHRISLHASPLPKDHLRLRNVLVRLTGVRYVDRAAIGVEES